MAALVPLTSLSKRFHYYDPATTTTSTSTTGGDGSDNAPRLILIASFMGAPLKHMHRFYVQPYHDRFPSTPIVLVMALPADWRPFSRYARDYDNLLTLLRKFDVDLSDCRYVDGSLRSSGGNVGNPMKDVLVHTMSNGGCWCLKALLSRMPPQSSTSGINSTSRIAERVLRPRTLILDSCPGVARYSITLRAFLAALAPKKKLQDGSPAPVGLKLALLRGVAGTLITVWYGLAAVVNFLLRRDPIGSLRQTTMLDQVRPIRRTYLYGDDDDLVYSADVEDHAIAAIRRVGSSTAADTESVRQELVEKRYAKGGYSYRSGNSSSSGSSGKEVDEEAVVTLVNFGPSPHVAHSRTDPNKYWDAIMAAWAGSSH